MYICTSHNKTVTTMLYRTSKEFIDEKNKVITLVGMTGVGKTYISQALRYQGWFHYSVDYRIGTRYMDESIIDNLKKHMMKDIFLNKLLRSDSIYVSHNISIDNLEPVMAYLGKLGSLAEDGLVLNEYMDRQREYGSGERYAMQDVDKFIEKSREIYGYSSFVVDSAGSLCEVLRGVNDDLLKRLASSSVIVYLESGEGIESMLLERQKVSPKPLYFASEFLYSEIERYENETGKKVSDSKPDEFLIYIFDKLYKRRKLLYSEIARIWGYKVSINSVDKKIGEEELVEMICKQIETDRRAKE